MMIEEEILELFTSEQKNKWRQIARKKVMQWTHTVTSLPLLLFKLSQKYLKFQTELAALEKELIKINRLMNSHRFSEQESKEYEYSFNQKASLFAQKLTYYDFLKKTINTFQELQNNRKNNNNAEPTVTFSENIHLYDSELQNARDQIRAHILTFHQETPISGLKVLWQEKKTALESHIKSMLEAEVKCLHKYYLKKFTIDALEQLLFKGLLDIEEQEEIRNSIFLHCQDPQKLIELINQLIQNKHNNLSTCSLADVFHDYLAYKYLIEFLELQVEFNTTLSLQDRMFHLQRALSSNSHELHQIIFMLQEMLKEGAEKDYSYALGPKFFLERQQLEEVLSIYQAGYYQKKLFPSAKMMQLHQYLDSPIKKTVSSYELNNNVVAPYSHKQSGFHHHAPQKLEQAEQQKIAEQLFAKALILHQDLQKMTDDDPDAQTKYCETHTLLLTAAEYLPKAQQYLESNFSSTILRFGFK